MEPTELTVEQVAAALKSREMTAEAYAEALLARAAVHADLNAFISQDPDAVRAAARAADKGRAAGSPQGPLAGSPLALQDNIDTTALPTTERYSQAGIVPISSTRDTAGPMTRSVADVVLLDGIITGGPTRLEPARLEGLRFGVPREYFYAELDPQLAEVVETELARLRGLGVVLVEADVPRLKELDEAASFPVALHETVTTLREYLRDAGSGLTLEALFDRVGSPDVKGFVTSLLGDGAVPHAVYKEAIAVHRPALQAALEGYFQRHDVAAIIFPTTPMPARPIGQDETVGVAGRPVPTFFTYIRNTDPASNAALPGLSLPIGLTRDGLPVGIELDAPSGRDHALLAIGLAYDASRPALPAPRL